MESPASAITNILSIDHLHRIPYTLYAPATRRRPNPQLPPEPHAAITTRETARVRDAERTLRAQGYLVRSDVVVLWVFFVDGLDGSGTELSAIDLEKDDKWVQLDTRLKEEWGLRETSTGVFLTSTLASGQPAPQSAIPTPHPATPATPVSAGSKPEPMTIDLTLDEDEPAPVEDAHLPYRRFLAAVLSSVTFLLALQGYTPLNSRTLVSPSSMPPLDPFKDPPKTTSDVTVPEIVPPVVLAIDVYMTSLGTLTIAPHTEKQPAIRRVATCGLSEWCLEGREVFVAPWGEWGRIVPLSEPDEAAQRRRDQWKASVLLYLQDLGVTTQKGSKSVLQRAIETQEWREVEVWLPDPATGAHELYRVLWPASLLFLRASESDRWRPLPVKEFWSEVFDDPEYARLAEGRLATSLVTLDIGRQQRTCDLGAEWWDVDSAVISLQNWIQGKPEREKLKAARLAEKKEEEERIRISKEEEGKPPPVAPEPDKKAKGPEAKNETGVYPTPPDAAISVIHPAPPPAEEVVLDPPLPDPSEMDLAWPADNILPAVRKESDLVVPATRIGGEADLFGGEMADEMDMYEQGLGVTEDDFDFFDQQPMAAYAGDMGMSMDMGIDVDMNMGGMDNAHAMGMMENPTPVAVQVPITQQESKPILEHHIRTPPLSPHRAIRFLVPGYTSPDGTPDGIGPTPPMTGKSSTSAVTPIDTQRKMSIYAPIKFTPHVEMADRKYAPGGRFFLAPEDIKEKDVTELPTQMERLELLGMKTGSKRKRPEVGGVMLIEEVQEDGDSDTTWSKSESESSDADDTDDEIQYSLSPSQAVAPPFSNKKRKRPPEDDGELAMAEALRADAAVATEDDATLTPRGCMMPDFAEAGLVGVFEAVSITSEPLTIKELGQADFLAVARVVDEQINGWVNSGWDGRNETRPEEGDDEEAWKVRQRGLIDNTRVETAVKSVFKSKVERCTLESYSQIADAVPDPPPLPPPPNLPARAAMRPNPALARRPDKQTAIFPLPPPHVHLHRSDQALDILPPALSFWETFGLGPCSGTKNTIAFCIHPASGSLAEGADFLLDRVGAAYEAGRFGAHVRANLGSVVTSGLVPVELPATSARTYETGIYALLSKMETLGTLIAHGVADEGLNIVIYVLNPFTHDNAFVDLALGFIKLCREYEASLAKFNAKPNHLALQIVPASFAASKRGPVLRVAVWHHLALEVYNRCIPDLGGPNQKGKPANPPVLQDRTPASSPAITIARKPPSKLEFRLSADPAATGVSLFRENSVLHVTYSQTMDERWVSVAWSDNTGELTQTGLINLSRKGAPVLKPFVDVLNDIWRQTLEILARHPHRWRLAVTRVDSSGAGVPAMPPDEADAWDSMAQRHPKVSALILLAATLSPPVRLERRAPADGDDGGFDLRGFGSAVAAYGTPPTAPTPTPGGAPTPTGFVSPDAFGNAANTPGGSAGEEALDPDAVLAEKSDDCWGVVLAHAWPAQGDDDGIGGVEKARASGLLVRACTIVAGVNVISTGGVGRPEALVREVLEWWRGLGVLARVRGGGKAGVPWHLAAVAGVERVGRVM